MPTNCFGPLFDFSDVEPQFIQGLWDVLQTALPCAYLLIRWQQSQSPPQTSVLHLADEDCSA
jgi:hypothetical protein